jgi:hypothetical protein
VARKKPKYLPFFRRYLLKRGKVVHKIVIFNGASIHPSGKKAIVENLGDGSRI